MKFVESSFMIRFINVRCMGRLKFYLMLKSIPRKEFFDEKLACWHDNDGP